MNERDAMRHALSLAWRGWGRVHPNPLVGAVLLRDGSVVGEGWHAEYGDRHAERVALDQAGPLAAGATLVVTLEPCAHQGKQPPCTASVLAAGVARVVFALEDPNPEARGGAAVLRAAGMTVEQGLCRPEAASQNAAFLSRFRNLARPWVALKLATTMDGRIADAEGHAQWISGSEARDWVHWLRAGFDAIAVGAGTVRQDDPSLTVRGSLAPRVVPVRVIFDEGLTIPAGATVARTARETRTIVLAGRAAAGRAGELRRMGVEVLLSDDLEHSMTQLRELGVERLLVEGGGQLAGSLLAADCVDRYYRVQSPLWLGDRGRPAFVGVPSVALADARRWQVVQRVALGADSLLVLDRP